jgi:hypothetical protein
LLLLLWLIVGVLLLFIPRQQIELVNKPEPTQTPSPTSSPAPLPPEVDPEGVYTSTITMPNGETGTFSIFLLSKRYVWVTGSKTEVEGLGDIAKKGKSAFSPELQESIRQAPEVIVVGTADVRNEVKSENARAGDRSRTLFGVVSKIKGNEYSVFNWNLGQWRGSSDIPLAEQRRIILIKVLSRTKGMNLQYGVRQTLEEHKTTQPIFGQMLNDYSKSREIDMR